MNSNKLKAKAKKQINFKLNKILLSLLNIKVVGYGTDATPFIEHLRNKAVCQYQSNLLQSYLRQPKANTNLELDKLDVTIKVSDGDLKKVLSQEPKQGMTHIRTKYIKSVINVEEVRIDNINENFKGSEKEPRPFYTHKFDISLVSNPETCLCIHVSDGTHKNSTKGFRFSYNPSGFNDEELCAVFSHLDSVLGRNRYRQLINKAMVTRIDIAIDLPGVLAAFLIARPIHGNCKNYKSYPLSVEGIKPIVETSYFGKIPEKEDKNQNRSSKYRVYDVLLNFLKKNPEQIKSISKLVVTARIEHELIPYQSGVKLPLSKLETCPIKLDGIKFIDPASFYKLPPKLLNRLLKNKSIEYIGRKLPMLKRILNKGTGYREISLRTGWLLLEQRRSLKRHKSIIIDPKRNQKELGYGTK